MDQAPLWEKDGLLICRAGAGDAPAIAAVYNSNPHFLLHHLGQRQISKIFIENELREMSAAGFISCVILQSGRVVGAADYRPGACAYLSLLILAAEAQGGGTGARCYAAVEELLRRQGCKQVRIDVVHGHAGSPLPFWQKLGFQPAGQVQLHWGQKTSDALVLHKELL